MGKKLSFDVCFDRLIGHEGGYVNNPRDPGGETKWGISKRSYPTVDIYNLTREGAKALYKRDFWDPITKDNSLPSSVIFQLFDFAVNSGIGTAIRALQRSVGVADDGHWGPISSGAASTTDENDMLMLILANRLEFMTGLSNWSDAGKGWTRRVAGQLRYAAGDN